MKIALLRSSLRLAFAALATVALSTGPARAETREIRLGPIEVGVTRCAEAERAILDSRSGEGGYSANATGAKAFKLHRRAFGLDFVQEGFDVCDEAGLAVAAATVTLPKHQVADIANALSRNHRQLSRNLPDLGDGKARFRSASGDTIAEITYVHVSFSADLLIQTKSYEKAVEAWRRREADGERRKLEQAF
jgi:hypothetical protein